MPSCLLKPSTINSIAMDGAYAYVVLNTEGINTPVFVILDYRDGGDDKFSVKGDLASTSLLLDGQDVAIDGNTAFVSGLSGVTTIDVTDRNAPAVLAAAGTAYFSFRMCYADGYAYTVKGVNAGLIISDLRVPTSPAAASGFFPPEGVLDVAVKGDVAYVIRGTRDLAILDITNRANPVLLSTMTFPGSAGHSLVIVGDRLFVPHSFYQLACYSLANPTSPQLLGQVTMNSGTVDLAVQGDHAFVAGGADGVQSINFTQPAAPVLEAPVESQLPSIYHLQQASADTMVAARGAKGVSILQGSGADVEEVGVQALAGVAERVAVRGTKAYAFGSLAAASPSLTFPTRRLRCLRVPFLSRGRRAAASSAATCSLWEANPTSLTSTTWRRRRRHGSAA